jgi:hypothetical protein
VGYEAVGKLGGAWSRVFTVSSDEALEFRERDGVHDGGVVGESGLGRRGIEEPDCVEVGVVGGPRWGVRGACD